MKNTKERIIEAALDLFSSYGYEEISVQQIADAVEIKAPSLYKHYPSKQKIFDEVIRFTELFYEENSVLAVSNRDKRVLEFKILSELSVEETAERICGQLVFITTNPTIVKTRKLIAIEHYRRPELCKYEEKHQYADVLDYCKNLISYFVERGLLIDGDIDTMALQLMSPIILLIQRIDRNSNIIPEAQDQLKRHIILFFKTYGKDKDNA